MSRKLLRRWFEQSCRYQGKRDRLRALPLLEHLEDRLAPSTSPVITTQPASLTVDAGTTAAFHAVASGNPSPTVQWEVSTNGGTSFKIISGATTTTFSITTLAGYSGDEFEAIFTNSAGSVTTHVATLTVDFAPTVITQPASQVVAVSTPVTLHAEASGNPVPTVQWEISIDGGKTFNPVTGATTNTLSFTAPSTVGTALFRAVFTNTLGIVPSNAATVIVDVPPAVTTQPSSLTVNAGMMAMFQAAASGNPAPTVQWGVSTDGGKSFKPISGATTGTLSFPATAALNGDKYEAVFTNPAGHVITQAATLTVDFAPTVTTQPTNQAVAANTKVTLHAAASGNPAPTVQWQVSTDGGKSFKPISGSTTDTLSFTAPSTAGTALYRAVFTNKLGIAISKTATVITDVLTAQPPSVTVNADDVAVFHASASGNPAPTVQWEISTDGGKSFVPLSGATTDTLYIPGLPSFNNAEFMAVFTNPAGSFSTDVAKLTVLLG